MLLILRLQQCSTGLPKRIAEPLGAFTATLGATCHLGSVLPCNGFRNLPAASALCYVRQMQALTLCLLQFSAGSGVAWDTADSGGDRSAVEAQLPVVWQI